jgi:hypothetical protein
MQEASMQDPAPPMPAEPPVADGRAGPHRGRHISTILESLRDQAQGERISFGDLLDAFESRAYGPLIVLLAAPNMLPVALPGISAILGAPLILLTAQLTLGRRRPWLPQFLRNRSIRRADFERLIARIVPRLKRIERMIQPRFLGLTGALGARAIGAAGFLLATMVFLPIPFGNALPGLALVLMAAGLLGRDGLAVLLGGAVGLAGLAVVSGFVWGALQAAMLVARHGLGI